MSKIEYNFLLLEISKRLDHLAVLEQLIFSCRGMLASESSGHDSIRDTLSLFKQLEESKWLGINRLQVLKDLLKGVKEWYLFGKVKHFEIARKEYNELIERIIRALDELNDVERLIAFCRMEVPEFANESNIQDARSLFKELENLNCLGIDCFGVLKKILTKTEQRGLLGEVQVMERRRNRKEDFETRKAQVAAFMSSVGNRLTGVLTIKTVFKVVAGGISVASVLEVLKRESTFDQLVSAVNECVLPAGTSLIQITEGCICLTVRAENLSSLETLWSLYKDGTLKARLQDFFVTEEVLEELAGGEKLEVIVTIEEGEYQKALHELSSEIGEDPDSCVEAKPIRIHRSYSDSNLYCKTMVSEGSRQAPDITERRSINQSRYLDQERLAFVQSYLENAEDARSMTTETSDSGVPGTRGTPSEFGLEDTSYSPYKPYLKDLSKKVTTELKCRLEKDPLALKWFYESFGLSATYTVSDILENISELFPDTPLKLLKDVFQALELHDLVEILEKLKPRTLRPTLPLNEIKKMSNASNRPTRYYNQVAVLIIDTGTGRGHSKTGIRIGSFFKEFNSRSRVSTVTTTLPRSFDVIRRWRDTQFRLDHGFGVEERQRKIERAFKDELELALKDLESISLGNYSADLERQLRTEELETRKELEEYIEMRKMKKKDKKLAIQKKINQTREEQQEKKGKFQIILEEWVLLCKGEESTLPVVCVDGDLPHELFTIIKEKLTHNPDEPRLVIIPGSIFDRNRAIPGTLLVQFPTGEIDHFQAILMETLPKRWQTSDLVSVMREVQRTFPLDKKTVTSQKLGGYWTRVGGYRRVIIIEDSLSSIPRLQKTEKSSE